MLSPDNYTGYVFGTQGMNPFSYANNNPLKYTDPDGNFVFLAAVPLIVKAAIIGAAIGAASYTLSVAFSEGGFKNWNWGQFALSTGIGAVSGVFTAGIGTALGPVSFSSWGGVATEVIRAGLHGVTQGILGGFSGQEFGQGFLIGAAGSFAGSLFQGITPKFAGSTAGMIAFSGVAGGVTAELTGGDFLKGAATGLTIGALNHAMHQIGNHGDTENPPKYKYKGKIYEDKAKLYSDILIDQAAEQFGIKDILALGTAIDGMGLMDKPFQMQGASKGTSLLSKGLSKALPQKMPFRLPTISNRG